MKTPIILAALLLTASLTVSCNSCEKRQGSELPTEVSTTSPEYDQSSTTADTIATSYSDESTPSTGTETTGTTTTTTRSTTKSSSTKSTGSTDNTKSGYSAKDGTDAENNDGDMYTKNNEKPMPTGTSIK